MTKDQKRKSKKKKRNIYRDPEDKRIPKRASKLEKGGSKPRREVKKSLDTRINGQNILQVSKQKSFYYKDDEGKIIVINDEKTIQQQKSNKRISEKKKFQNLRNNQLQNKGSENLSKINNSDLYYHLNPENQYGASESRLFRRKTTRPVKSRGLKNSRPFRGCDSVRDPNFEIEKRENSLPTQTAELDRQKTFDNKQSNPNNKYNPKMQKSNGHNNNRRANQIQTNTDNERFGFLAGSTTNEVTSNGEPDNEGLERNSKTSMSHINLVKESQAFNSSKSPSKHIFLYLNLIGEFLNNLNRTSDKANDYPASLSRQGIENRQYDKITKCSEYKECS